MSSYYVIRYRPGQAWPAGKGIRDLDLDKHAEYIRRLFGSGTVILAGPLGGDQGGVVVISARSAEDATSVMVEDPAVKDGVFTGEVHAWRPVFDATGAVGRAPAEARRNVRPRFEQWLNEYKSAWEDRDPQQAAALFSREATYQETPFDEPMRGIDAIVAYWSEVPRTQRDIVFEYQTLAVEGDTGHAHWHATFTRVPSGVGVELDGILSARFDAEGLCVSFKEWWHRHERATAA